MIEQYINTKRLLAEHKENKKLLRQLIAEYQSIDGARALDYTHIPGGSCGDAVSGIVEKRLRIRAKIDDYSHDINMIDGCINELEPEEQAALKAFFMTNQSKTAAVNELREVLHIEQSAAYALRKRAIRKFDKLLIK